MSNNVCRVCGHEITVAIRKGTGICSGNCEKQDVEGVPESLICFCGHHKNAHMLNTCIGARNLCACTKFEPYVEDAS